MGKFNFKIINLEEIHSNLLSLKNNSSISVKEINLISKSQDLFLPPIDGIQINFAISQLDNNKVSLLAVINQNQEIKPELTFEKETTDFSIRNIDYFGTYVFAGRPDLAINRDFASYIDLNNQELFLNKLRIFENLINSIINEIFSNIELNNDINYSFEIKTENCSEIKAIQETEKQEIPSALKRLYQKLEN